MKKKKTILSVETHETPKSNFLTSYNRYFKILLKTTNKRICKNLKPTQILSLDTVKRGHFVPGGVKLRHTVFFYSNFAPERIAAGTENYGYNFAQFMLQHDNDYRTSTSLSVITAAACVSRRILSIFKDLPNFDLWRSMQQVDN